MSETIEWLEWAEASFAMAAARNVPIALSLVTAWSEECLAMDRTIFANPEVAAALSTEFIPIRVDADRRPDVNDRYNLGGWPTTAFLTPDRELLSGGTYLDVPQLLSIASQVSGAWRDRSTEISALAARNRSSA